MSLLGFLTKTREIKQKTNWRNDISNEVDRYDICTYIINHRVLNSDHINLRPGRFKCRTLFIFSVTLKFCQLDLTSFIFMFFSSDLTISVTWGLDCKVQCFCGKCATYSFKRVREAFKLNMISCKTFFTCIYVRAPGLLKWHTHCTCRVRLCVICVWICSLLYDGESVWGFMCLCAYDDVSLKCLILYVCVCVHVCVLVCMR